MSADELLTEIFNGGKLVGKAIGTLNGIAEERERILLLLGTKCKPNDHDYINGCNCDVIALIKGEN
jgi:hypothetical protein